MKIKLTPQGAQNLLGNKYTEWSTIYARLDFSEAKLLSQGKNPNSKYSNMLKSKEIECSKVALKLGYHVKAVYQDFDIDAIFGVWIIEQANVDLAKLNAKIGSYNYSVEEE